MFKPEKNLLDLFNDALAELEQIVADLNMDDSDNLPCSADETITQPHSDLSGLKLFQYLAGLDKQ